MNKMLIVILSCFSFSAYAQDKMDKQDTKNNLSKAEIVSMPIDDNFEAKMYKNQAKWMSGTEPLMLKHIIIKMNEKYYNCSGGGGPGVKCWIIENKIKK